MVHGSTDGLQLNSAQCLSRCSEDGLDRRRRRRRRRRAGESEREEGIQCDDKSSRVWPLTATFPTFHSSHGVPATLLTRQELWD